ncbi:hypothetical protein HDV64DRAFT_249259, partial [Trichoderma sp. TUCIM 5745]
MNRGRFAALVLAPVSISSSRLNLTETPELGKREDKQRWTNSSQATTQQSNSKQQPPVWRHIKNNAGHSQLHWA